MQLSIVLPCFNEEKIIRKTVESVFEWMGNSKVGGNVIVTEDGATDGSANVLKELKNKYSELIVVSHPINKGYASSLRDGCDAATTEYIAFMDSDGQFDAKDFDTLLTQLEKAPLVAGIRKKRADHFGRIINSRLFNGFACLVLGIKVSDIDCGMKVFTKEAWRKIRPVYATGALFNAELFYNAKQNDISFVQVPINHYPRLHGKATGAKLSIIIKTFVELFMLLVHANAKYFSSPRHHA